MTGLQVKAYRCQSVALILIAVALISLIMGWWALAVWLIIGSMACLTKAMMYRERWELDQRWLMTVERLREIEQE